SCRDFSALRSGIVADEREPDSGDAQAAVPASAQSTTNEAALIPCRLDMSFATAARGVLQRGSLLSIGGGRESDHEPAGGRPLGDEAAGAEHHLERLIRAEAADVAFQPALQRGGLYRGALELEIEAEIVGDLSQQRQHLAARVAGMHLVD